MKIGFDIGGVISKYPQEFKNLVSIFFWYTQEFYATGHVIPDIYIITDQHPKEEVLKILQENGFGFYFEAKNVYCADYEKYGNMAKAILIKELGIQIFIDDFDGYLQWDSSLGLQPLLLKVQPDWYKPYWHEEWKVEGSDFGRRKASLPKE